MNDEVDVLDFVREEFARVHGRFDRLEADMADVKIRLTSVESKVALLHQDFAGQSARIDRVEQRLGWIEKRLELADAPPA